MTAASGRRTRKRSVKVATVFTGVAALGAVFAPAAAAKSVPKSAGKSVPRAHARAVRPDTITGWILEVHAKGGESLDKIGPIYACEYFSGRTGKLCSLLDPGRGATVSNTHFSQKSNGAFLYNGEAMLVWYSKGSPPAVTYSKKIDGWSQYKVTAQPGQWNRCALPSGGGTDEFENVYAGPGISDCLDS